MKVKFLDINNVEYIYKDNQCHSYEDLSKIIEYYKFLYVERCYDNEKMYIVSDKIMCIMEV